MFEPLFHHLLRQQGRQDQLRMILFLACDQKLHGQVYLELSSGIHRLCHGRSMSDLEICGAQTVTSCPSNDIVKAPIACVIPPASLSATFEFRKWSNKVVFPWSTCPIIEIVGIFGFNFFGSVSGGAGKSWNHFKNSAQLKSANSIAHRTIRTRVDSPHFLQCISDELQQSYRH